MKTRGLSLIRLPLIALLGGLCFCTRALGDIIWTINCDPPKNAGVLTIELRLNNVPFAGRKFDISLTGQETAAQKAAKIADVMDSTTFPVTATANGNAVTVDTSLGGLFIN